MSIPTFNCRPPDYVTPAGYQDESFTYVYDTSLLTNGNNYEHLAVPLDPGEDFLLRRIDMGAPLAYSTGPAPSMGKFRIRDSQGRWMSGAPMSPGLIAGFAVPLSSWSRAIVPEVSYPGGGQLRFDLYNIRQSTVSGINQGEVANQSQALFHGVIRRKIQPGVAPAGKPFRRQGYSQVFYANINWPGYRIVGGALARLNDIRRFQFGIDDYDFELYGLHVRNTFLYNVPPGGEGGPSTGPSVSSFSDAAITIFDPFLRARSSGPIMGENMDLRLSLNQGQPGLNTNNPPTFPFGAAYCPPIVYPAGGVITLDIQSLCFPSTIPCVLEIVFVGSIRIPS